jgi:hypothetical protein
MVTACLLCGDTRDTAPRLSRFDPPLPTGTFSNVVRCRDEQGCRERVKANGDEWPLQEERT